MIAELIIHYVGWTDVWYAQRWHVGFSTGPDKDLVCVRHSVTADDAEEALSPSGYTVLHATVLSAVKLVRLNLKNRIWGRDIVQVPRRGDGPGEVERLHGEIDREKLAFWSLQGLYDNAALSLAKAREILQKATESDGTLEELAETLVLDVNAEHERAEEAERKLDGLQGSDAAEHRRLASACEEYLDALAPPHISGDMPCLLRQLAFELRQNKSTTPEAG
jgi:hypothetical protein